MAQLDLVIGSILRDIISAQHEANLYSLALSESYGKNGKVKDFQLPNVIVSDMELELKYGVINTLSSQEQCSIKYTQFRKFIKELCNEMAKVTISSVISTIMSSDIDREKGDTLFFSRLKKEDALVKEFSSFLSRNMKNAFTCNLFEAVNSSDGSVKVDVVVKKVIDVVRKKFLYDTDLDDLFVGTDGAILQVQAEKNVQIALEGLVVKLSKDVSFKKTKSFPQLDVAVTANELANMPEEAIHSFKLTFSPRNYSITQFDDDEIVDDFIMQ